MDYSFQGLIRIGISEHYPYIHVILLTAPLLAASLRPERQLSMLRHLHPACMMYNARHIRFKAGEIIMRPAGRSANQVRPSP